MPLSVFTFRRFVCQSYEKTNCKKAGRDKQRLGFKNFKHIGADETGGAPCGKHKAIYLSNISRTEGVSGKGRHRGESASVAGQQIARYDHEEIVACHIAFGNQQI